MHIADFRLAQEHASPQMASALVQGARRRFLAAARLLEWNSAVLSRVEELGITTSVPYWPFAPSFSILAQRYRDLYYTPQASLMPEPDRAADQVWSQYYYWKLLPHLLRDDFVVRSALRLAGALPSANTAAVAEALATHFKDMNLPDERPLWSPDEGIEYGAA